VSGAPTPGRAPTPAELELWRQAAAVAGNAHAPYSGFQVGAAVRCASGSAHLGVNVESAAYPAGMCAERVALGAAVTAAGGAPLAVATATADGRDVLPCGLCLQALAEFGDLAVVGRVAGETRAFRLSELLTTPFSL
jgi:cytidine deaminase